MSAVQRKMFAGRPTRDFGILSDARPYVDEQSIAAVELAEYLLKKV
jgi:hypothetical protein